MLSNSFHLGRTSDVNAFQVCSTLFDLHFNVFLVPILVLPAPAMCTGGVLKFLGPLWGNVVPFVSVYPYTLFIAELDKLKFRLFQAFVGAFLCVMSISILFAFVYRWLAVIGRPHVLTFRRSLLAIAACSLVMCTPIYVFYFLAFSKPIDTAMSDILNVSRTYSVRRSYSSVTVCSVMSYAEA